MHRVTLLVALPSSSAAASAATTLALAAFNAMSVDAMSSDAFVAYPSFFLLLFGVTMLVASSLGLAWHALAMRKRWVSLWAYIVPAAAVGCAIPLLIAAPSGFSADSQFLSLVGIGAAHGGLTAAFAWLIRRPDRDSANPPTQTP